MAKSLYLRLPLFTFLLFCTAFLSAQALTISVANSPGSCNGICNGKVAVTASGGVMPYTYDWSNDGPDSPDNDPPVVDGLCAGTYTVTVTDAAGTTRTATTTLGTAGFTVTSALNHASCFAPCGGAINLTVTGGVAPYSYSWPTGEITEDISALCPGSYVATITDANGCTQVHTATILTPTDIEAKACPTDVSCYGGHNGFIDVTVTGNTQGFVYLWSNGATTQDISNLTAGVYTTTITNLNNGCTTVLSASVNQPTDITISSVVSYSNPGNTGAINLTVSGGTPGYTYLWLNSSTAEDLFNVQAGTYSVTVTDSHGCTKTHSVAVNSTGGGGNTQLVLGAQVTNTGCQSSCSGSILATVNNGVSPYTATLTQNGQVLVTGQSVSGVLNSNNLCAGIYCLSVVDGAGLTTSACYTVLQSNGGDIDIRSTNAAFCNYDPTLQAAICEKVCPHTKVTYFFEPPTQCGQPPVSPQNFTWTISGAASYTISSNNREVAVTWGDPGPGLVTLESNNPDICYSGSRCITVVEEPVAQFVTDPPAPAVGPFQLCKGQNVSFVNKSLNAELYEWYFSDDLSSVETENAAHTFNTSGMFNVTLIAKSNCLCADTTVLEIEVLDSEPPLLDCVGSVCPGETVKYSTSSNCSAYTWVVSPNGTVMDGGTSADNTITIQWGEGPVGAISLSASGCGGAACPQASVFTVSIISDNAEIRGREFVCPENEEEYSIDLFDGAEYTWTLPSGGTILRGQGTNKISIAWNANANPNVAHQLNVEYYNCYLGCGGRDTLPVKILSPFVVQGAVELCERLPSNFTAKLASNGQPVTCNWVIYQENGTPFWTSSGPAATIAFPNTAPPGKYRVFAIPATPGQTCSSDAEQTVAVIAQPPKPGAIGGPTVICPGAPVTYEVLGNAPYSVQWNVNGGVPGIAAGNPLNVNWLGGANRWVAANYVSNDGLGCKSDTLRLDIAAISGLSITGVPQTCDGSVEYYSADFHPGFDYQWSVVPASAGAIKSGQGSNAVEVFWQTPGNHQLRVTTCSQSVDFSVTVWANPQPVATFPDGLCAGATGTVGATQAYTGYAWKSASGSLLSSDAAPDLPAGNYAVEVTDAHGCKGADDFKINQYPDPNVSITTADPTGVCGTYVSITALTPDGGAFDYEWFLDGNPFGGNTPVISTNQYGLYSVTVHNQYGCSAHAGTILVFEYCGGSGGGPCTVCNGNGICPPGVVQAVADPTMRCDSFITILNDYSGMYVPGTAVWRTGVSGGPLLGTKSGESVSFVYPNAGKYIIDVQVTLSNGLVCEAIDSLDVEVSAQFSQKLGCPGDSTRFIDESTRLPEADIASWKWDFGVSSTTSDSSTDENPGYPYADPGNYTATLTITSASGCTSSYSEPVFVPTPPAPTFTPPLANCAGNASEFILGNASEVIKTEWDFGHPASGALNTSEGNKVYHNYNLPGSFPVAVTATNGYGCKGVFAQMVDIVSNPFTGDITPLSPVICEGKTVTLMAPTGSAASFIWSDGTTQPTLIVGEEGVYDVTLTNGNGCTYSPPSRTVDVNPAPAGTIKALDINDLGQVIGVSYPTVAICEGEDLNLQVQDNGSYTYQWSGGNGTGEILTFSEDRGNELSVGTHIFTVTVTNPSTGCTAVFAPFEATVNPIPKGLAVATDKVCAGTPSTVSYLGPQPGNWQIFWNTGETGPSITTEDAGLYFVRVVNEFGCSAESNSAVIFPGPNIAALPSGCHERCTPDTLCIPAMPGIVAWQWYFQGNLIPGANSSQFAADQSGTYYAELTDNNGCKARSADLTLDLYDGYGNILGQVWSDVNNNGVIDPADTLAALVPVQLLQNGAVVNNNWSDAGGGFLWPNVLSTQYQVQIDTQLLSQYWEVVIFSDSVGLSGCGGKTYADLLVKPYKCPPVFGSLTLSACQGGSVLYNGEQIPTGTSRDFTIPTTTGCDSILTVTVAPLPPLASAIQPKICPGSTYTYQGVDLLVGQSMDFTLQSAGGCDSIVTVAVQALPVSSFSLDVKICAGDFYTYQGQQLGVGQTQAFTLQNYQGCDSTVTVSVGALPGSSSSLNVKVCAGDVYTYQGQQLGVGQTQAFTLQNYQGCDSIVTVSVAALPSSSSNLNVKVCAGDVYTYQGQQLGVGQTQAFTLQNYQGCDSIVTVSVAALPSSGSNLNVKVCPGDFYTYQNQQLGVGQTQAFTLQNYQGCDSTVTVSVGALPTYSSTLDVKICQGEVYTYQGQSLNPGQTQAFTLNSYQGCDSVVTVRVTAKPSSTGAESIGVCPQETTTYQGQSLGAGTVKDFILTNWQGCDSVVTVTVYEKPNSAETRSVTVCPGGTFSFQGVEVGVGQTKDFHLVNYAGCDSLITVEVKAHPAPVVNIESGQSCPDGATGSLQVWPLTGGSQPVGYALNGGAFQPSGRFDDLPPGTYSIVVRDDNGCQTEQEADVAPGPHLEVELPGAMIIPCDSVQITLTPQFAGDTTGLTVLWQNGSNSLQLSIGQAGPVWLEAGNHCGETLRKEAEVEWADSDGQPIHIFVPNIFSPDAKQLDNTLFRAYPGNNFTLVDFHLEVFDRWGNKLFVAEQPEQGWDGFFRNTPMTPGVYVWYLKATVAFCGRELEIFKKGDVTVER